MDVWLHHTEEQYSGCRLTYSKARDRAEYVTFVTNSTATGQYTTERYNKQLSKNDETISQVLLHFPILLRKKRSYIINRYI